MALLPLYGWMLSNPPEFATEQACELASRPAGSRGSSNPSGRIDSPLEGHFLGRLCGTVASLTQVLTIPGVLPEWVTRGQADPVAVAGLKQSALQRTQGGSHGGRAPTETHR